MIIFVEGSESFRFVELSLCLFECFLPASCKKCIENNPDTMLVKNGQGLLEMTIDRSGSLL
jgi:hypothetical protein